MCFQAVQIFHHLLSEVSTEIKIKPKIKTINGFTDFLLNLIKKQSSSKVLSIGQVSKLKSGDVALFLCKTVQNCAKREPSTSTAPHTVLPTARQIH